MSVFPEFQTRSLSPLGPRSTQCSSRTLSLQHSIAILLAKQFQPPPQAGTSPPPPRLRLPSHPALSRRHHATHQPARRHPRLRVVPFTFLSLFCHHIRRRLTAAQNVTALAADLLAHAFPAKPRALRARAARVYTNFCAVTRPSRPQVNCRSKRHRRAAHTPRARLSRTASGSPRASRPSPHHFFVP